VPELKALRAPTSPVRLVLLMAASLCINYIDRGNLGTAGPLVQSDLQLSPEQFGWLGSAFYFTYTLMQFPAGWLADRFGAKIVLAIGATLWSVATLLTGFAAGFVSILLLRFMLGIGESAGFTTTSKLIAERVPKEHVGLANGVTGFGYLFGPAIGTLAGGLLMARFGWRPVFMLFGAVSLLWLVPWARVVVPEVTLKDRAHADADAVPTADILAQRSLWGASIGHFCGNYNFYFILYWLPSYLVSARGFSMEKMATVAFWAYALNAGAALFAGWAIDRWIRRGGSATFAHKLPMALAHLLGIGCMFGLVLLPVNAAIACLYVYEVVLGFSSPGYFAIPQILGGPAAAARWVGIQNKIGNSPGIIAPALTGWLVGMSGSFVSAFAVAGIVNLIGFFGWVLILGRVELVDWAGVRRRRSGAA
jgi:MFS family permease